MHTRAGFLHAQTSILKHEERLYCWCSSLPKWVKYPSLSAKTLCRQFGFFSPQYSVSSRCTGVFHSCSPRFCISPPSASSCYHQTLSAVPVVGSVNDPLTAVPETSMMSSPVSREGKRGGGTALWPSSGSLALFFRDIGPFVQVPHAFWGLWGVAWTPVAHGSFPGTVEAQSLQ